MVEMVCAIGVLVLAGGAFYSASGAMGKYKDKLLARNEANCVLDNSIERISAEKAPGAGLAGKIFLDEFAKSPLSQKAEIKALCEIRNGFLLLGITDGKGKRIAELKIKIRERGDEK